MNLRKTLTSAFTAITLTFVLTISPVLAATVTVDENNLNGWLLTSNSLDGASKFSDSQGGAPGFGTGSVRLASGLNTGGGSISEVKKVLDTPVNLNEISNLSYFSYVTDASTNPSQMPFIKLSIDNSVNGGFNDNLYYYPGGSLVLNTWQNWTNAQSGDWYSTNASNFYTLSAYIASDMFPGAKVIEISLMFESVISNDTFDGNVDGFTIGVNGADTSYDFEKAVPVVTVPTNMDECKNGGWATFTNPAFKNQGQCVAFVESESANHE